MSFTRYCAQRISSTIVLLFLIAGACFLMLGFVPGSFFDEMRLDPRISSNAVDALRDAHGLTKPVFARFGGWIASAIHGDLGTSFASNRPVAELLLPRLRNTLILAVPAALLAWTFGVSFGIWSAATRESLLDRAASLLSTALNTVPEIVLCCLVLLAAARTGIFPVGGMVSPGRSQDVDPEDFLRHLALPVLALAALTAPTVFFHTRAAMLDVFDSPFVKCARAHGISRRNVLCRHVLPVASNSLISLAGISIGGLLSASLITEILFAWPGVGPLFLDAISARDPYLIIAAILCFSGMLIGGNLMADLALHYRDPRLRTA